MGILDWFRPNQVQAHDIELNTAGGARRNLERILRLMQAKAKLDVDGQNELQQRVQYATGQGIDCTDESTIRKALSGCI